MNPCAQACLRGLAALALVPLLTACSGEEEGEEELVAGRVVTQQEETPLDPGPQPAQRLVQAENPFEGDDEAEGRGRRLWQWYNCADCHGVAGGGGIGPPIADGSLIYGEDPASIYQSIAQGRPEGMPAFGGMLPEEQIWQLVTYVQAMLRGEAEPVREVRDVRIAEWEEGMLDARRLYEEEEGEGEP